MYSQVIILALFASAAFAAPSKRAGTLSVKVKGPQSSITSLDDLKLVASVTNTGSSDVKVLKYGTVLDNLPTRSFTVSKDGNDVKFTGVSLSVKLNDGAFTTIASGQTIDVEHNLAALYDFSAPGAGKFSFKPLTSFKLTGATNEKFTANKASTLDKVTVDVDAIEVEITGDLAQRDTFTRRAETVCDDAKRKDFIDASYTEAKELATVGSEYIASKGASDALYKAYFGAVDTDTITEVLGQVAAEDSTSRTLNCKDTENVCDGNVIAYTIIATTDIYFCDVFFDEQPTDTLCSGTTVEDRDIRGGTTLHELTHALSKTDDITYGCEADKDLSDSQAPVNADNYNCFTTEVYAKTQCSA